MLILLLVALAGLAAWAGFQFHQVRALKRYIDDYQAQDSERFSRKLKERRLLNDVLYSGIKTLAQSFPGSERNEALIDLYQRMWDGILSSNPSFLAWEEQLDQWKARYAEDLQKQELHPQFWGFWKRNTAQDSLLALNVLFIQAHCGMPTGKVLDTRNLDV